jgi:uncharacterized protein
VRNFLIVAALFSAVLFIIPAGALNIPDPKGYINDYAEMISPDAQINLEAKCRSFEMTDSTQIVVITISSLEGEAIEDFGIRLAEKWKIGQAKKDNGAILIISKEDRRIRIEVGRGLEGVLTDLKAGRIIDNIIRPNFKAGDYDKGIISAVDALIAVCRGEFKNETPTKTSSGSIGGWILFLFIGLYILTIIMSNFSRIAGGVLGAAGLPAIIHFALSPIGMGGIIAAVLFGFVLGLVLPLIPIGGGSGRSGGGFWSGGSSSGGSFSGGGGSFGGGGSSGGW